MNAKKELITRLHAGFMSDMLSYKPGEAVPAPELDQEEQINMIEKIARQAARRKGLWVHEQALESIIGIIEDMRRE